MASILKKARDRVSKSSSTSKVKPFFPEVVRTSYTNVPVPIPSDFLAPLPDASVIEVNQIDFKQSVLPEYRGLYAVVLDNVLSQSECDELIHLAEKSVGAHQEGEEQLENNGWKPAMVNAGRNHEVLALDYRNSDRIIWDEKEVVKRLWDRVLQAKEVKDYITVLDGKKYTPVIGPKAEIPNERYKSTEQGINERMRFLKYGAGQFFRRKSTRSISSISLDNPNANPHQNIVMAPTKPKMGSNARTTQSIFTSTTPLRLSLPHPQRKSNQICLEEAQQPSILQI